MGGFNPPPPPPPVSSLEETLTSAGSTATHVLDPSLVNSKNWGTSILLTNSGGVVTLQAANLAGFHASEDPRFEAGIPDFMDGILNFSIHFNVVHRKVDWPNPKMKSLNSMPALGSMYNYFDHIGLLLNVN